MIERYTRPGMGAIWTEENRYRKWLAGELAGVGAWARPRESPPPPRRLPPNPEAKGAQAPPDRLHRPHPRHPRRAGDLRLQTPRLARGGRPPRRPAGGRPADDLRRPALGFGRGG